FECTRWFRRVLQVLFINWTDMEGRAEPVLATGVFTAQELQLFTRRPQDDAIFKAPPRLDLRFGNRHYAGVGLRASRRAVIDAPVRVDNTLVGSPGALGSGPAVQGFPHMFGDGKFLARPRVAMHDPRIGR